MKRAKPFQVPMFSRVRNKLFGESSPKGTFRAFFAHVKRCGFTPRTVVDVGVAYGTEGLYSSFPEARFLMVEPLEEFLPYMKRIQKRHDAEIIVAAAGPENGHATIRIFGGLTSSSVIPVQTQGVEKADKRYRTVDMITLDSLLSGHQVQGPILLKLDIQGAELMALEGATEMLEMTELIVLETSLFRFHGESMPDFYDVVAYMKCRGFVVYDILGGFHREIDGALGQVDLVFVKESGRFRETHVWA